MKAIMEEDFILFILNFLSDISYVENKIMRMPRLKHFVGTSNMTFSANRYDFYRRTPTLLMQNRTFMTEGFRHLEQTVRN